MKNDSLCCKFYKKIHMKKIEDAIVSVIIPLLKNGKKDDKDEKRLARATTKKD